MLTAIIAVTLTAPDLGATTRAYTEHLHYRVVDRGHVSASLASGWDTPKMTGHEYVLLQPASGAPCYLRIVQNAVTPGFTAMKTHGWNSNEILVRDVDDLAQHLRSSPFKIIGEPRPLSSSSSVRAMQVIGPAGELNYLTQIPPLGGTFIKSPAQSYVDRTFIVVLGGADMNAMRAFYRDVLHTPVTEPYDSPVQVLNGVWSQPVTATTKLALVNFSTKFLIELDQYPPGAIARPRRNGELPPGMAMVSFEVDALPIALPWAVAPAAHREAPYNGRKAGVVHGAAGEWIELVEAATVTKLSHRTDAAILHEFVARHHVAGDVGF